MDIWAKQGPDVGKLQVSFATTPSDELSEAGFGSANSGTSIDEVGSFSGWFVSGNTGVRGDLMDCYNAAPIAWTNSSPRKPGTFAGWTLVRPTPPNSRPPLRRRAPASRGSRLQATPS